MARHVSKKRRPSYPSTETSAELRKRYGRSVSLLGRRKH